MDAKEKILSLIKEINQHNINYYVDDNPTISDSNYDILIRELENLEMLIHFCFGKLCLLTFK